MMLIGSTLPAHNLQVFQARRAVFECSGSPLNPLNRSSVRRPPESLSTEATKKHLSNLERLLQKQSHPNNPPPPDPKNEPGLDGETRTAGSILEGLSLARVWPEMKAAEEMSPRHLNRLQRLLSKSAEYSPRSSLGSRWREYHGSNDWAGMLDPLDENLRREVVRYGEFIQAAYHGFHSQPATSADEALRPPRRVALPDRSYRVTRSLYATASVGLPKWVDDVAPDLGWMTQLSSWVGYVAVCDDPREIQRMGRRDIVIALRGTATCLEWAENIRNVLIPIPSTNNKTTTDAHEGVVALTQQQPPKVECGFLSLLKTRGEHVPSLAESVVLEIQRLMEKYKGETLSITITGHSLGAALALLVGHELSTCIPNAPPVAVFSFGGPRVGNRGFASRLEANKVKVLRIVNSQDLVTRVPGMFVNEEIDTKLRAVGGGRKLLEAIDRSLLPWAYTHVGTELRVDTKMSPFLRPDADVACCHDLEAYLHLVDGFLASNCPFRPNAKRSLWRLLNEQRSNVKRLYTSKAKALTLNNVKRSGTAMSNCLPSPS